MENRNTEEKTYKVPESPQYKEEIRALTNNDPADADTIFNPLFERLIENTHHVKCKTDSLDVKMEEVAQAAGDAAQGTQVEEVKTELTGIAQKIGATADSGGSNTLGTMFAKLNFLVTQFLSFWTQGRAAKLDHMDVNVSTRADGSVWTAGRAAKLDLVDANVSTRAPANTAISNGVWTDARAAKLDNLNVDVNSRAPANTALSSGVWTNGRAVKLDNLNVDVNSRAPASTALSNGVWTNARAVKLDNLNVDVNSRAPASTALSNSTWTNGRAANLDRIQAVLNTPNGDSLGAWINSISTNVNTTAARTLQDGQSAAYWAKVAFDHAAAANTNASAAISKAEAARVAAVNAGGAKGAIFLESSAFKDGDIAINLTGAGILLAIIVATGNSGTSQCSIELDGTRIGLVYLPTNLGGSVMLTGNWGDSEYCMGVSTTPGASLNIPYKSSLIIRAIRCTYTNSISVLYIPL